MTAETIAVGAEVLLGDITDTNSAELGRKLAEFGVFHYHRQTVGDNVPRLADAVRLALSRADLVFTIGGLGPTGDDVTREGIASALGIELETDEALRAEIEGKLRSRGVRWTESQTRQAMRPPGSEVLPNPNGTAPGLVCRAGGKTVVAMPGPRSEFVPMLEGPVSQMLGWLGQGAIRTRTVRIVGMGESLVEERVHDLTLGTDPTVSPYAKPGEVHLRVRAHAASLAEAAKKTDPVVDEIVSRLGPVVYGLDDESLESCVLSLLRSQGAKLAVAESCTGGGLGERLTSVAGASDVFLGGVVAYSNALKESLLGVPREVLDGPGAVSEECARAMAEGAVRATGADWGVSVTGIAGPDGGSAEKPVGLVYIGVCGAGATRVERNVFPGVRDAVRERSGTWALAMLRRALL